MKVVAPSGRPRAAVASRLDTLGGTDHRVALLDSESAALAGAGAGQTAAQSGQPMTLFELQAWLGHRSPNTTQHYAKNTPKTLSKADSEARYFARNIRAIEVLIDRYTVSSGAAAAENPGSTTTSATAGAPTASSNNARTE